MSRSQYAVKETYTGTGSLDEYTFDFKITDLSQLLIIEVDDTGVETQRVRGDDVTYLSGVVFDSSLGGGTITLAANLTADYQLIILLADDEPTQDYEFRNKTSFTLRRFEDAYDRCMGAIQRLVYKAKQSLRIHDIDDEEAFDGQLPSGVADQGDHLLIVNAAGDGFDYGPDWNDIPFAQATADSGVAAAAAAQATADQAVTAAATAQTTANTAVTNAATAQAAADAAQADADTGIANAATAQSTADAAQADADALEVLLDTAFVATESIAAAGTITVNTGLFQNRKVQGNGAARTTANAPFGSSFVAAQDGMRILLVGKNAVNTLTIPYADTAWGAMLNGDCTLGLNQSVELILDYSAQRFYEIARNF